MSVLNIKPAVKRMGFTHKDLAERLGVSRVSVGRYMEGNAMLSSVVKIAEVIPCDISDLFAPDAEGGTVPHVGREFTINLRQSVKEAGISINTFAERMGVSQGCASKMLSNQEAGKDITISTLQKIAAAVGCDVLELFRTTQSPTTPPQPSPAGEGAEKSPSTARGAMEGEGRFPLFVSQGELFGQEVLPYPAPTVAGFVEIDGTVHKITSMAQLIALVAEAQERYRM